MADKKDPGRFTMRFNIEDPQQQAVAEILNRQGRMKAQLITNAVLHYMNCSETPNITPTPTTDRDELEQIIMAVLRKHAHLLPAATDVPTISNEDRGQQDEAPVSLSANVDERSFNEDALAAISKTLQAFYPK